MTSARLRKVGFLAIPVFAIGGFVLDLFTPLGISDWVCYFIPLLLSVYVGGRFLPILLAAVFSLLMLAGFFLSPPGMNPHLAMFNRAMGVSVLWLMAFVIWQRKRANEEVPSCRSPSNIVRFPSSSPTRPVTSNMSTRSSWR